MELSFTNRKGRKSNNIKQTKNETKTAPFHIETVMKKINTEDIIKTPIDIYNFDPSFKGVIIDSISSTW